MKRTELDRMSTDDLWSLHIEVSQLLQQRIQTGKTATGRASEAVAKPQCQGVGRTRRYPPNTAILISRQRLGPVVASSRAGWLRSWDREGGSRISE